MRWVLDIQSGRLTRIHREIVMPRGKRNYEEANHGKDKQPGRPQKRPQKFVADFGGWVNYTIPTTDQVKFEAWLQTTQPFDELAKLVERGHKFSLAWDEYTDTPFASVFVRNEDDDNAGYMTSQRSTDSIRALCKLIWALGHGMPDNWVELSASRPPAEW